MQHMAVVANVCRCSLIPYSLLWDPKQGNGTGISHKVLTQSEVRQGSRKICTGSDQFQIQNVLHRRPATYSQDNHVPYYAAYNFTIQGPNVMGQAVGTPTPCSGGHGFKFQPGDWLSWQAFAFFVSPSRKMPNSTITLNQATTASFYIFSISLLINFAVGEYKIKISILRDCRPHLTPGLPA
jgi:hypothetical protein